MAELARKPTGKDKSSGPPARWRRDVRTRPKPHPKEIVAELDRYIIGQDDAKRAVAVALRNRYRRQQLPEEMRSEVHPKNILMIGSTGVGKTEIARRVARIVDAPFIKVEATKFTEVGYVGRDVESIVRDLVEIAISMLHNERMDQVKDRRPRRRSSGSPRSCPKQELSQRPPIAPHGKRSTMRPDDGSRAEREAQAVERRRRREQKRLRQLLDERRWKTRRSKSSSMTSGEYDDVQPFEIIAGNPEDLQETFYEFLDGLIPRRRTRRRVSVREARGDPGPAGSGPDGRLRRGGRSCDAPGRRRRCGLHRRDRQDDFAATPIPARMSPVPGSSATCCRSSRARP